MTNENADHMLGRRGLTLLPDIPGEDTSPPHRYGRALVTTEAGPRAVQSTLGWDVAASGIVRVNECGVVASCIADPFVNAE